MGCTRPHARLVVVGEYVYFYSFPEKFCARLPFGTFQGDRGEVGKQLVEFIIDTTPDIGHDFTIPLAAHKRY